MKGSIRTIVGLLVVFGAVGFIETATDAQLLAGLLTAALGLGVMASGTAALNRR